MLLSTNLPYGPREIREYLENAEIPRVKPNVRLKSRTPQKVEKWLTTPLDNKELSKVDLPAAENFERDGVRVSKNRKSPQIASNCEK